MKKKDSSKVTTVTFNFITKTGFFRINSTTTYLLRINKKGDRGDKCEAVCVFVCVHVYLQTPIKKDVPPLQKKRQMLYFIHNFTNIAKKHYGKVKQTR